MASDAMPPPDKAVKEGNDDRTSFDLQEADTIRSKAKDPLLILPREIINIIISLMNHRQLVQMLRLSKPWNHMLRSTLELSTVLDFSMGHDLPLTAMGSFQITPTMLLAGLERVSVPKSVTIASPLPVESASILITELQSDKFNSIQTARILGGWFVPAALPLPKHNLRRLFLGDDTATPSEWVCDVVRQCVNLEHAAFLDVILTESSTLTMCNPTLEILTICCSHQPNAVRQITVSLHEHSFDQLPRLCSLDCHGLVGYDNLNIKPMNLRKLENLKSLTIKRSVFPELYLPASITSIDLDRTEFPWPTIEPPPPDLYPALDNLERLTVRRDSTPEPDLPIFIEEAARKTDPGKLRFLKLDLFHVWDPYIFSIVSRPWCRGLERLDLCQVAMSGDENGSEIASLFPRLRELSIVATAGLTEVFVYDLVNAPDSELQSIFFDVIDLDERVMDRSVISWAKERGVNIVIKNSRSSGPH